jgi:IclR family KDG regulon transcriptional repressor
MKNISGTVNKAIDVLELFLKGDPEIGLTEISELTGYNNTTTHRLLTTMVERGLIQQSKKNGKYSLGLKTLEFSFKVRLNLRYLDTMYLHLSKLCREQNVPVNLTVLDKDDQIVIDEIGIVNDFRYTGPVGQRLPLHATAPGKVFLAYLSEEERASFYSRNPLEAITQSTITDIDQLNAELKVVRENGIAFDEGQFIAGVWAVAAPVFRSRGEVVCVAAIILPLSQITAYNSQGYATALKRCTTELSVAMSRIR